MAQKIGTKGAYCNKIKVTGFYFTYVVGPTCKEKTTDTDSPVSFSDSASTICFPFYPFKIWYLPFDLFVSLPPSCPFHGHAFLFAFSLSLTGYSLTNLEILKPKKILEFLALIILVRSAATVQATGFFLKKNYFISSVIFFLLFGFQENKKAT